MSVRLLHGDCREVLKTLPSESVHCVVTSPPYFGLRDYGVSGQIGLEPTPQAYVDELVGVFREVRRALRADGTVWVVLGDSYAGSWGAQSREHAGKHAPNISALSANQVKAAAIRENGTGSMSRAPGLKPKDLIGIPWRVAFALQADGWWLRSSIVWHKPNPMPESVTDRPTSAHENMFLLAKSERYYFDAEAVKEKGSENSHGGGRVHEGRYSVASGRNDSGAMLLAGTPAGDDGRNIRNVWTVATQPYPEAHFATFPPALIEPCIKAGTSEKGCCPHCGKGWGREVERPQPPTIERVSRDGGTDRKRLVGGQYQRWLDENPAVIIGWSPSCSCPGHTPVPATILDPFGGAGTTVLVADRLGRNAILIELNPTYAEMAEARLHKDAGMFASVETEAA